MPKVSISSKGLTCIYGVLSPTGKIYIGQTWDLYHRYKSGVSKNQRMLYRSYQKHGEGAHKLFTIIEFKGPFTQPDLDYWERYYIEVHKREGYHLLNIREGGGNQGKLSEVTKKLIGVKAKKWRQDNPERARELTKNATLANIGKKRSDETRKTQSIVASGKSKSPSHCINISLAKKGKPSPHKGKHFSPEAVERIRVGIKSRKSTGKLINQYNINGEFIKIWPSITEAAKSLSLHPGTIQGCVLLKANYKTCGGFIWRYSTFEGDVNPVIHTQIYSHKKRPVVQYDKVGIVINEYESIKEAARHISNETSIRDCCEGKYNFAGGFIWKYK
jgi:group I intron endonuclease